MMFVLQTQGSDDPVLLWLQGGPGGSSLFGALVENGPFGINKDLQSEFLQLFLFPCLFPYYSANCTVVTLTYVYNASGYIYA